jgi:MFS family permease
MTEIVRPEPSRIYRWLVLIFVSLAMFGSYYAYDALSPLANVPKQQLGFSDVNVGFLQFMYSFPNLFFVVIGGIIIDRFGLRAAIMIFAVLSFIGPALTAATGQLPIMATGRLNFGMGAESLNVACTTALARWFRGKELSFALGLNLTASRLGTFAALNSPTWARAAYETRRTPLFIAAGFSALCVVAAITYWVMEECGEKRYDLGKVSTDKVVFTDLWKFGGSYWLIVALCVVFYSAIFPFQTFAVKFFIEAHGTSREFGGGLLSMLTLFAMIATPIFGFWVDRIGKRALLMMFGSSLLIPVYLMMAYTQVSLYAPMAMMGVAFSLIPAVMWASVILVDPSKLGTAYGLMTMLQNIGFSGLIGSSDGRTSIVTQAPRIRLLSPWHVDFLSLGVSGRATRFPLAAEGNGNAWPWTGNNHDDCKDRFKKRWHKLADNLLISRDCDSRFLAGFNCSGEILHPNPEM